MIAKVIKRSSLATAASVTGASSVRIDSAADNYIQAIDLSAGTTGNSTINASASNSYGMQLIGGSGRDTILGGKKNDAIIGNAGQIASKVVMVLTT